MIKKQFSKKQFLSYLVLFSLLTLGGFLIISNVSKSTNESLKITFDKISGEITQNIQKDITSSTEPLLGLSSYFSSLDSVSYIQFKSFTSPFNKEHKSLQALSWIPIITKDEIKPLEQKMNSFGFNNFTVFPPNKKLKNNSTPFYPVTYIHPIKGNEKAIGFDLGSKPQRLIAINKAIESNSKTSTAKITLVQESGKQAGILVIYPYTKQGKIKGLITGVFRIGDLVDRALDHIKIRSLDFEIYDSSFGEETQTMYSNTKFKKNNSHLISTKKLTVADRTWDIKFKPNSSFFLRNKSYGIYYVGGITMLIIILILYYLYNVIININTEKHQKKQLEKLVLKRTKLLERKNKELETFAYAASHDLKTPLRGISNLITFIEEDLGDQLGNDGMSYFLKIKERADRMDNLIDGILNYSKIDEQKIEETVEIDKIVREISNDLSNQFSFEFQSYSKLPTLRGNKVIYYQLFQNIMSNGLKYNNKENKILKLEYSTSATHHQFTITDNGIGIEEKYHDLIFKMFYTNESKDINNSTGIGLALVAKIIENLNGTISVQSILNESTSISFKIPIQ